MNRTTILKDGEAFFCKAMAQGYASGVEATPAEDSPCWKGHEHKEGDFRLIDRWTVHSTGKSVGHTTIEYKGRPMWFMTYGGTYTRQATKCLRSSLLANYRSGAFEAGRGINLFREGPDLYMLDIEGNHSFSRFRAKERIVRINRESSDPHEQPDTSLMGYHDIWGMALI